MRDVALFDAHLTRGVRDKRAALAVHDAHGRHVAMRLENGPQVALLPVGFHIADEQRAYARVRGRLKRRALAQAAHHLFSDGVVDAIVAVADVLLRELPRLRHLVAVGALGAALAFAARKEGAQLRTVPLHNHYGQRCHHTRSKVCKLRAQHTDNGCASLFAQHGRSEVGQVVDATVESNAVM